MKLSLCMQLKQQLTPAASSDWDKDSWMEENILKQGLETIYIVMA